MANLLHPALIRAQIEMKFLSDGERVVDIDDWYDDKCDTHFVRAIIVTKHHTAYRLICTVCYIGNPFLKMFEIRDMF